MNWALLPKYNEEYIRGVKDFVSNGLSNFGVGSELRCPCKKYTNRFWHSGDVVYDHLICQGPYPEFVNWIYEISTSKFKKSSEINDDMDCDLGGFGLRDDFDEMIRNVHRNDSITSPKNQMNKDAINFYRLVEEGKQPLYPGSKTFTRLSFVVGLYMLKCTCGFTESAFSAILELIKEAFPESNLPPSFSAAKGMIKELGLDYEKIHACPNDCMLYWTRDKDENVCKVCEISRWKTVDNDRTATLENDDRKKYKVPAKVLRYFPLKPRLQRIFLSKEYSELMTWHATGRVNNCNELNTVAI